jgi:hypothetical protein
MQLEELNESISETLQILKGDFLETVLEKLDEILEETTGEPGTIGAGE